MLKMIITDVCACVFKDRNDCYSIMLKILFYQEAFGLTIIPLLSLHHVDILSVLRIESITGHSIFPLI